MIIHYVVLFIIQIFKILIETTAQFVNSLSINNKLAYSMGNEHILSYFLQKMKFN
jgi:hypothetical protein